MKREISLKTLALLLTLIFVGVFVIISSSIYKNIKNFLITTISDSALNLAKTVELSVISYYLEHNYFDLKRTALKLSTQKELVYAIFYDSEGEVITAVKAGDEWEPDPDTLAFRQGILTDKLFSEKIIVVGKPIEKDEVIWGYLKVALRADEHINILNLLRSSFIITSLMMIVLAVILFFLFAKLTSEIIKTIENFSSFLKTYDNTTITRSLKQETFLKEINQINNTLMGTTNLILNYQEELKKQERLKGIESVASYVAHDIKNILSSLLLLSDQFLFDESISPQVKEEIKTMKSQMLRITALLNEILEYVKGERKLFFRTENFAKVVEEVREAYKPVLTTRKIDFTIKLIPSNPVFIFDRYKLYRMLLNLMKNSIDAIEMGGKIMLEGRLEGDKFIISFSDNGKGIPSELLNKIFEEGFTTKPEGTGLGLPMVKRIVEMHKGKISVHSQVGKGTTVIIELPVNPTRAQ